MPKKISNILSTLAPQWLELYYANIDVWGRQYWVVEVILSNITKAQDCLTTIYNLSASIRDLQDLQSLGELTLDQSEQLEDLIRRLDFKKACFNTHLCNNIQPMDGLARENMPAYRILSQIPANVFRVEAL